MPITNIAHSVSVRQQDCTLLSVTENEFYKNRKQERGLNPSIVMDLARKDGMAEHMPILQHGTHTERCTAPRQACKKNDVPLQKKRFGDTKRTVSRQSGQNKHLTRPPLSPL